MSDAPKFWQCPRCKTPNPWASYLTSCLSCGGPRPAAGAAPLFVPPAPEAQALPPRKKGQVASALCWTYLAIILLVLAVTKLLGDRWWPSSLLVFGPRWIFLFPIPLLLIWAGMRRRWRAVGALVAALVLVVWPLMGLRLPIMSLFASPPNGTMVRVLSLNRGTAALDSKAFVTLVSNGRYDIVCIQEARPDPVLDAYFLATKWNRDKAGTIWTKFPIVDDLGAFSGDDFEVRGAWPARLSRIRVRLESGREVVVANAHLPTMSYGFEGLLKGDVGWVRYYLDWRSRETDRLVAALRETAADPMILAGDFNMPPDSAIMAKVREHYTSGFEAVGWGFGYTRPSRLSWIGIDRVLASRDCRFLSSSVGPRVGSDHRPIDAVLIVPPRE